MSKYNNQNLSSNSTLLVLLSKLDTKLTILQSILLVVTSLAAETTKKLVAAFCNLGIEFILKALNFVISSQTSFWYPFKCGDRQ